jgi:putative ABC transport system permease protein
MPRISYQTNRSTQFNPLRPVYHFFGVFNVILKRQRHYLTLTVLALVNIILAVGLINNAAFFSQAVDRVVMLQELSDFSKITGRPPLSTSIYVFPSRRAPITLDTAEQLSQHIKGTISSEVGLPSRRLVTQVTSGSLMLQPSPGSDLFAKGKNYLGNIKATYIEGVASQMKIVDGAPLDEKGASKDVIDIWIYDSTAQEMGINVGDKLIMGVSLVNNKMPVQVAGIWKAIDPKSDFWFNNPDSAYKDAFLVRRTDYIKRVQPNIASGTGEASWYVILDEKQLRPRDGEKYLNGFDRAQIIIDKYLPGSKMNTPPRDPLKKFVARSSALTIVLLGYNLPAFGILLYFLILTSAIMAQWQRRETVMLVSRGLSGLGVLNLTLIEQLILFVIGYPLGILFGMAIAWAMGFTSSFLTFTPRAPLPVSLEGLSLPLTFLALAFAMISRLWPASRAIRSSLVTEERERARPMHKPFWYRFYLDIILLAPTYYAFDQMFKRGSLAGLVTSKPEDLYRDPLLIIVPALFILTVSLVTMRVFAILMRLIDLIAGWIPWLTIHLALRQLGRQSLDYVQPMLLVIIALAMGVYTLSMATSLDHWTVDRMYYRVGADMTFTPKPSSDTSTVIDGSWTPLPGDFKEVKGVKAATRVGDFAVRATPIEGKEIYGRFLAIDRTDFPSVAWYRSDFANESLGALMNRLAVAENGILVPQTFLQEYNLRPGDTISMVISIENLMSVQADGMIAGTYNYFPNTKDDSVMFIGNLDYLSTLTGLTVAHDIWLKLDPNVDHIKVPHEIASALGIDTENVNDTQKLIEDELSRQERIGIFGTLTIGFLATALMAILGLLIYSYSSLQERAYRLAVLNAVGLSRSQIMAQVILEYVFLALFGATAGAIIGTVSANLFVPFFRFTGEKGVPLPPLIPVIANSQLQTLSLVFGIIVVVIEVISIASILSRRLAQILKRVWI